MLGEDTPRSIFVTEEVHSAVTAPFPDGFQVLHSEFRQTLDGFLEHGEMSVGLNPRTKASDALLARVCPVADGFWDFRITSPQPQIRAFGGFCEKNSLVLVTWQYRDIINNNFDAEVDRCKREWQKMFGDIAPFRGNNVDDYLSNYILV